MSGVVKGVKKVFKPIGKVVKKIAPFALPIAAAVFTVGGALGVPFMAGGFGGTVGRLFGNSTLGKIMGGAVTQAGFAGLGGMALGGIAGGKKGMKRGSIYGQAIGGVLGGIGGAISAAGNPAARAATGPGSTAPTAPGMASGAPQGGVPQGGRTFDSVLQQYGGQGVGSTTPVGGMTSAAVPSMAPGAAQMASAQGITQGAYQLPSSGMAQAAGYGGAPAAGGGGFGQWTRENPMATAMMIQGGFQSAPAVAEAMFGSKKDDNQQLAVEEARRKAIRQNYTGSPPAPTGFGTVGNNPVARYEYDQAAGRIVLKYA